MNQAGCLESQLGGSESRYTGQRVGKDGERERQDGRGGWTVGVLLLGGLLKS